MKRKEKKPICPKCKSTNVLPILYGLPAEPIEIFEDGTARQNGGLFWLGGCVAEDDSPLHYCKACKHEW